MFRHVDRLVVHHPGPVDGLTAQRGGPSEQLGFVNDNVSNNGVRRNVSSIERQRIIVAHTSRRRIHDKVEAGRICLSSANWTAGRGSPLGKLRTSAGILVVNHKLRYTHCPQAQMQWQYRRHPFRLGARAALSGRRHLSSGFQRTLPRR